MKKGRPQYLLLLLLLLATHGLAFSVQRGMKHPSPVPSADPSLVPLTIDGWQGKAGELDQISKKMLRPDAYLVRDYFNEREGAVDLTVLLGQSKSNFHSPALCLTGAGWGIISKRKVRVALEGSSRPVNMTCLILQKGRERTLVLYSFLSPGNSDADWFVFQARFLLERLQGRQPRGALLRLITPVYYSEGGAESTAEHFLSKINPYLRRFLSI
jgi:EpsI family protein